jgi:hypothetical protein
MCNNIYKINNKINIEEININKINNNLLNHKPLSKFKIINNNNMSIKIIISLTTIIIKSKNKTKMI